MTQELFWVVINVALGAPDDAETVRVAPIAPEPKVPVVLTPAKLITVIETGALSDRVAVTDTPSRVVGANARHISPVPGWARVRSTDTHVNPPPETPVTSTCVETSLAATKARSSSLPETVDNPETAMLSLEVELS
jgi:hypothetical protein